MGRKGRTRRSGGRTTPRPRAGTPARPRAGTPARDDAGAKLSAPSRPPATPPRAIGARSRLEEAPKAPWSPFPLVELTILVGIVLAVLGFIGVADRRGALLGCGFALISLSALELSIREHFAGYRSHSALLAGAAAVLTVAPLFFLTGLRQEGLLAIGVLVFGGALLALRAAFRRRTGGIAFRA